MPKAKAAKPSLSSEFVVDSDDSGDAKTASAKKQAPTTAKSESRSAKPVAPKPSVSQAKPSKKRKSPSPSPTEDDSSDSGSRSDSNHQDETRPSKKRVLAAQDGSPTPRPKLATARPVLAKPSIKPSANVKPLDQRLEREPGAAGSKSKSEAGGNSEDGSSGSESGSGSESESGSSDEPSLQSPRKESPVQKSVPQQPAPTYEPPVGFKSTSISLHPASKLSEILAPSNLQGKEIWHITAPETVPISLMKQVSTQKIGNGASILDYHGANYGLVPESEVEPASRRALFLPSNQTNEYQSSKTTIIKTLHLQEIVSLPSHALDPAIHPNRSPSASESYRKTPRQQPEGLRMRYRPFGVSDDSDLESNSELVPKAPEFRIPAPVKENSPGRKRKRRESNDASSNTGSTVKSKKRKKSPQATAGATEDPMDIDGVSDKRSNGVKSPTKSMHLETNGSGSNGNLANGNETKEERRKRREKKKLEQRESPSSKPATAIPLNVKQKAEKLQPREVVNGVPAAANAVEGTTSINDISSPKESKDEKAKRREEKRRLKAMARATTDASLISAEDVSQRREVTDSQDRIMNKIQNAPRDASVQISTPRDGSPQKQSRTVQHSQNSNLGSSQFSQRKETKEERRRRKEEKRRLKVESGSA